jgi:hypothetical protein
MLTPLKYTRKYAFNYGMRIVCILFILLGIATFKLGYNSCGPVSYSRLILSILGIFLGIGGLIIKYVITEYGPGSAIGSYIFKKSLVHWDDIELIYDDNFSSAHFYRFKLRGKSYWSTFIFQNGITNYKDFLREAIMRVRPDTIVEDKILQLVGFTHADIGKLYKPPPAV